MPQVTWMEDVAVDPDFSASKARFSLLHLSPTLPSRPPSLGVKTPHRVQTFRAGASGFAPNSSACGARKSQKVEQGGYTRGQHLSTHTARRGGGCDRMSPRHAGTAGSPCQIFGFFQENPSISFECELRVREVCWRAVRRSDGVPRWRGKAPQRRRP